MPGSFASSPTRLSIADTLERQLEWEVHASSKLRHLGLRQVCGLLLRVANGHKDKIFEHLDASRSARTASSVSRGGPASFALCSYCTFQSGAASWMPIATEDPDGSGNSCDFGSDRGAGACTRASATGALRRVSRSTGRARVGAA